MRDTGIAEVSEHSYIISCEVAVFEWNALCLKAPVFHDFLHVRLIVPPFRGREGHFYN